MNLLMKAITKIHNMVELNFSNLIIFTLLIILLVKLFTIKKRLLNLPPSPLSFPILGHLPLLKQPLHETLHHLSRKFGPIMLLRFGVKKALVVSSPSLVEECFTKTNDIIFANRPLVPSGKHMHYNFTSMGAAPYGHLWRSLRRVAAFELFSTTRLSSTTYAREHEVKLMCKHIYKVSSQKVELKSMFRDLLNNITTMSMIGKRYHGDVIDSGDVQTAPRFREIMEEVFKLIHTPYIGDFLPFFAWIDLGRSYEKRMIAIMKRVDVFFDEVIENRCRTGNSESGIIVDKLLALQEQEPELYTDQIIKGHILVMLVAGTETPYLTLEWAMSLLLNHPNAMKKIKKEIDTHVGTHRLLQEDDLEKLSYLQNVINESMRLYPTLPMLLPREASQDTKIGGYYVPSGTMLMVNAWAIQRDPILWDKPDDFMPERFGRTSNDKYKMLAFGVGRRGCPGTTLGYRVLGLALGTLIQAFEWEKIGNEMVDMNAFYGMSMAKLTPLQALCKPRPNMIPLLA